MTSGLAPRPSLPVVQRRGSRGQSWIRGQAEIIVGAEIHQRLSVENDRRALRTGMRDELTAQMFGVEVR